MDISLLQNINIGIVIVVIFMIANLAIGIFYSKNILTIREYALGGRNFSTPILAATIVATWMAGSNITITASEAYKNGLYYIIPGLADGVSFFIIAYLYAPRMIEFLGNLSVAEAMGNLYGKNARIITAISAIIIAVGNVAVQFSVCTILLNHFLGISELYAISLSSFIVIAYSSFGGIKAVTFTDMIQFFTFCIVLPMVVFIIWQTMGDSEALVNVLTQNPIFDYKEFFNFHNPSFWNSALLFMFFIIPGLDPALFQRISMAKNVEQVTSSFTISGFTMIIVEYGVIASIGILLLATNDANLDPDSLMTYILDNYMREEFRGFFVIGILAMLMSTADSYINSSSVLLAYDLPKAVGINLPENKQLFFVRLAAISIGICGLLLSLFAKNLLDLILFTYSFYMPIVSVPLLLAIFGFRSTNISVLTGMGAGFVTVLSFKIFMPEINNIVLGMAANLIFLFASHYIFRQTGGWIGIQDNSKLEAIRNARKRKFKNFIDSFKNFDLLKFCRSNAPREESFYVYFGLLSIISIFSAVFSLPIALYNKYNSLVNFLHYSILIISTIFITYPIWADKFKNENLIASLWNFSMIYCLVIVNSLLFIISDYNQIHLTILVINLMTLSILLPWQVALWMMIFGILSAGEFYKWLYNIDYLTEDISAQFKIIYLLFLLCSILIAFLKPRQEYVEAREEEVNNLKTEVTHLDYELTDLSGKLMGLNNQITNLNEQVEHYSQRTADQALEIERLGATAQKILNNVNHELRLPVGNVMNFSQMLYEVLSKSDNKLVSEMSKEVYDNSNRVSSMILNMLDLATLDVKKLELQKKTINFGELVEDRVKTCRKIYLRDKKIDFELRIEPEILIAVDPNYIRQTIDNLVINAINFSEEGLIRISVFRDKAKVIFKIEDQGKGIDPHELSDIFTPFKMGIKSESKAKGRGVGLALCKSAIEAHKGSIMVESDGERGAKFTIRLNANNFRIGS